MRRKRCLGWREFQKVEADYLAKGLLELGAQCICPAVDDYVDGIQLAWFSPPWLLVGIHVGESSNCHPEQREGSAFHPRGNKADSSANSLRMTMRVISL